MINKKQKKILADFVNKYFSGNDWGIYGSDITTMDECIQKLNSLSSEEKGDNMELARLTHEAYNEKQIVEFAAGSSVHEYMDYVERLLAAASFPPEVVRDGFIQKAAEIENDMKLEKEEQEDNEE